jgi:predicted AlkP superfamily pyrophosphatase or phosphodiesterase
MPRSFSFLVRSAAPLLLAATASFAASTPPRPSLVVVIAIDQFRGDYLERFRPHFVPGGFNLLLEQGAVFTDAHQRHSVTKTACGHAVILTGVHANANGIIGNDWIDRGTLKRVNCVDDDSVQPVGVAPSRSGVRMPGTNPLKSFSPRNLLVTTVGDELQISTNGRAKVIGISSKDRSAILLGGKLADAAYWMDKGRLVSSTYYMKELPTWAAAFNDSGRIDAFFGQIWDRVLPAKVYEEVQGPDDVEGESSEWGLARTFPKVLNGGADKIGPVFYDAFECSPFKSEVMMAFARVVVENENLGRRGVTDVLGLSFSSNDNVGHNYGPHSHEVMDISLRTDRMLAEFFKFLDGHVGLKNCTIILTADHGIPPLPERLKAINPLVNTGRVDTPRLLKTCETALDQAFGPLGGDRRWLVSDAGQVLFAQGVMAEKKIMAAAAENVVRDALLTVDFIQAAFTRSELETGHVQGEGAATQLSFNKERSGDVIYYAKPFWVDRKSGTNHGTPHNYDTHVPLVFFGAGVKPGVYTRKVGIDDVAPTLSHILGLPAPPRAEGNVLF